MAISEHAADAISATLKISGGPPLPGGFRMAEAWLNTPVTLHPGQWIEADAPVALFDRSGDDRISLIVTSDTPSQLTLKIKGSALVPHGPALLVSRGLAGLGGLLFAARRWRESGANLFAAIELPVPAPFQPTPARIWLPQAPDEAIAALPLLEDWGVPNRLASVQGAPGCFNGDVLALAEGLADGRQHYAFGGNGSIST